MVEYPEVNYILSISSIIALPLSNRVSLTRARDAFNWETPKLVDFILKDLGNLLPNKPKDSRLPFVVRRIHDKNGRWLTIRYRVWPKGAPTKTVRLALCEPHFRIELDRRQEAAKLMTKRVSEILYDIDPADLASVDAPKDEYDSEAEWISERIFVGGEEVSFELLKEVFESMFGRGVCENSVYEKTVISLRPIVQEHVTRFESLLNEEKSRSDSSEE